MCPGSRHLLPAALAALAALAWAGAAAAAGPTTKQVEANGVTMT